MMRTDNMPSWLQQIITNNVRQQSLPAWLRIWSDEHHHAVSKHGLPSNKNEWFKYDNFTFLADTAFATRADSEQEQVMRAIHQHRLPGDSVLLVFIDGIFHADYSSLASLPKGLVVCPLDGAHDKYDELIKKYLPYPVNMERYPFASINAAAFSGGLFIYCQDDFVAPAPIHLLSIASETFIAQPCHLIVAGKNSKLTILEESFSLVHVPYWLNSVTRIVTEQQANLNYIKLQNEGSKAQHLAHYFLQQLANSHAVFNNFAKGSQFARDELAIEQPETNATCAAYGFYRLHRDKQALDYYVDITHQGSFGQSEMLYKGILSARSQAVFNGRLHIKKAAQNISAYQANHNLLLSDSAQVYSKPELEIYADQVKCKHGATIGQLDPEALFYLRSRGISTQEATNMLVAGFAQDIVQQINHQEIKDYVLNWCPYDTK